MEELDNKIKDLIAKKAKLETEALKFESQIDALRRINKDTTFRKLKKEIEMYNISHNANFIEEIKEIWKKEDEDKN